MNGLPFPTHVSATVGHGPERLPRELTDMIIEESALDPGTLRHWTLVSKTSKRVALPLLYHTLEVQSVVSNR